MYKSMYYPAIILAFMLSMPARAGIVVESTRYLYKQGAREITAQIDNKDNIPYLIKSWVESPKGQSPSFMVTPPLFRLEGNEKNTVRVFSTANLNAPTDRESIFYFNVMAIPPSDDSYANANTVQLAVRHRMRLVYRPQALLEKSINSEAEKLVWKKAGSKLTVKNPTPFFFYFNSIKINGTEIKSSVNSIGPLSTKEVTLEKNMSGSQLTWKIVNDYGGAGSLYSTSL